MLIVKFENGSVYSIDETKFIIRKEKEIKERADILITSRITNDLIRYSVNNKLKLFECDKGERECLESLVYALFPNCKSCKFI